MTETSSAAPTQTVVVGTSRTSLKEALAIIVSIVTALVTFATLFVGGGRVLANVDQNRDRIVKLEARADRRDTEQTELRERIAGMDAKLDLLIQRTPPRH